MKKQTNNEDQKMVLINVTERELNSLEDLLTCDLSNEERNIDKKNSLELWTKIVKELSNKNKQYFWLNEKQYKKMKKWEKSLDTKNHKEPSKFTFSNGSGIGTSVIVTRGEKSIDLTDYDEW